MTTVDLKTRTLERLGEDPAAPVFYTSNDALSALNLAQRIFAFLTLCLETRSPSRLTAGNQWYALQKTLTDAILVLRCEWQNDATIGNDATVGVPAFDGAGFNDQQVTTAIADTAKLLPGTLDQFAAKDNGWYGSVGRPTRYHALGFSLLVFDLQPDDDYTALLTYARMPVALVKDTDVPEIPEPDHQCLIDFAVGWLRVREGGQELANDTPALSLFLDAVRKRAAQVRARSLAQRYDHAPPEIEMPDLSRLLKKRSDLLPGRKENAWT